MITNYLLMALRTIMKRKLFSLINATGLSIGIAFCILIFLYIQDERSFDQFHRNKSRLYILSEKSFDKDAFSKGKAEPYRTTTYLPAKLAEVLNEEAPEVEYVTRYSGGSGVMRYQDKVFKQSVTYVDSGFFRMFSFTILSGNPEALFRHATDAVLTTAAAQKYFGLEDPLGKLFTFAAEEEITFRVAGIIETPPTNSSLDFEVLLPLENRPFFSKNRDNWGVFSYPTFVQLHAGADPNVFRENLVRLTTKYMNERIEKRRERENIPDEFIVSEFGITALPDLHLDTNLNWEKSSDPKYSYILSGLGLLILIIASINYIALALTTSAARRVEVGIRKVAGAQRKQLVWQFTVESGVLALLSLIIGFGLVFLFLPFFNEFTGKMIALNRDTFVLLVFTGLALSLIVGVLAGSYPSFFLSGFRPAAVLKGRFTARVQAGFTKPLVVFQFALSAFLMISSVIMFRQMSFITQKDLGYSQDQVIVIPTHAGWNEESDKAIERFRNSASNEPTIARVSGTSSSFNQGWSRYGYRIDGETKFAYVYRVDTEYLDLLEIDLVAGRNFNEQIGSDTTAIIVNEALAKDMGWEDPLSEHLNWRNDTIGLGSKVIGVVKDYHFLSLERNIEPMFLSMSKKDVGYLTTLLVKLHAGSVASGLEKVRVIWQQLYPDKPFEYSFLDEDVAKQYDKHKRWTRIASFATFFAIFIACLGLFGLAGINAVNKTKEIGIRKVLGAGLTSIFVLLNKQYAGLACIAFLVAAPFSWYVMAQWLRGFQYSIELTWSVFVISMVSGIAIALLTVTYHGIRAALINPAETLKYE